MCSFLFTDFQIYDIIVFGIVLTFKRKDAADGNTQDLGRRRARAEEASSVRQLPLRDGQDRLRHTHNLHGMRKRHDAPA